ncbi:DUF4258 domain-containing protein [Pantoea rwandensis]|uniref:DUF4258 domain-containing protein n=1 Tax=Pantoea rwandensis TaxID=1076550 RepID=A0A1X1D075_9GAMM|nr:DUF4258 domain-containing protein [Pantoea rwandensis]ORM69970.1 hypothetical protein HA51_08535 [Pantoea rwandensis]
MNISRHAYKRMNERCINKSMIDMVLHFGSESKDGDKIILDKKTIEMMMISISEIKKQLERIKNRGGVTLVESENTLITTYFNDSFNKKGRIQ